MNYFYFYALLAVGPLLVGNVVESAPIALSVFSSPTVETFEAVATAPNFVFALPTGYVFPSGVTLKGPNPNSQDELLVLDFLGPFPVYGLFDNGTINSSTKLRSGTGYVVEGGSTEGQNTFTFEFPGPVSEVGLFVSALKEDDLTTRGIPQGGSVDTPITMQIFDTSGGLIESHTFATTSAVPLTDDNFIGVGSTTAIGSFAVSSPVGQFHGFAFDDVIFQPTDVVPEPGTWFLVGLGAGSLVLSKGRRTRKQHCRGPGSKTSSGK